MQVEAQVLAEHGLLEGMSGPGEAVVQFHAFFNNHNLLLMCSSSHNGSFTTFYEQSKREKRERNQGSK